MQTEVTHMLRFEIQSGVDEMVARHASNAATIEDRDRLLAARFSDMYELRLKERGGDFCVVVDGERMRAYGHGPTVVAMELIRAQSNLANGDGEITARNNQNDSGVCLEFKRLNDRVWIRRTFERPKLFGPAEFEVSWDSFVDGVDVYLDWHHNEYTAEATWLLQIPYVQQMRVEAGLPADHL